MFPPWISHVFSSKPSLKLGTEGDRYIIQDLLSHLHGARQLTWMAMAQRFPENRWEMMVKNAVFEK